MQLFSWRIGQAQTLAGARIISTNTDGLYSVLDAETNNRVLAEQSASIGVDIEPEPLIIVTKDANNRLELKPPKDPDTPIWEAEIASASGSSLACHEGPQPTKALAHPAVLDYALARYLRYIIGEYTPSWRSEPLSLDEPLDKRLAKQIMHEAIRDNTPVQAARLFQNVIAASAGKLTFPYQADPIDPVDPDPEKITNAKALQHYNRVFVVHQGKPGAVSLRAAGAWVVNAASRIKRQRNGDQDALTDRTAMSILASNGYCREKKQGSSLKELPHDQDVASRRIPGIDPSWSMLVENGDLRYMSEDKLRDLLGCLDLDIYVDMLATTYEKNWKNHPEDQDDDEPIDE